MDQVTDHPSADAVQPGQPPGRDENVLKALGMQMRTLFEQYEKDRVSVEQQWTKNYRQYKGIYDPEIDAKLSGERSKAYPKLTRVKCVSMLSRLMNMMFPASEKNWTITPSPVPNIDQADLQAVIDRLQQSGKAVDDRAIEQAVMEFAKERARNLEKEIEDQLTCVGGSQLLNYVTLCRKVLLSGIQYGMGVLRGPLMRHEKQRRWEQDEMGMWVAIEVDARMPQLEFVPLWDYYPDMTAKYLHQMDGQFQRMVMNRAQLRELAEKPEFFGDKIIAYLRDHRTGNFKERAFEGQLRQMGVQTNVNQSDGRKYEVILWDGFISGNQLKAAGVEVTSEQEVEQVKALVYFIDNVVIRAEMNPWVTLSEEERVNTYHHFVFEEDDSTLTGNGLPQVMRDSQMGVAASARMILDNAGAVCGPIVELNDALLDSVPNQDKASIGAFKTFRRDDDSPATMAVPAVRNIVIDSHLDELLKVENLFRNFADLETFVNAATGGDLQEGPSEPFRTAAGASMLRGDAALPFKDVVRNFDSFTQSTIGSLIAFNRHFNLKSSIKGDFQPVPRGSTSLIAKEVRGIGYDTLAQSLTPQEALYIDWRALLRERLAVRDMDTAVMVDDAEAERREQAQAERQAAQDNQLAELMKAEVRKTLADAVKSLTQADKNASAAEVGTLNAILGALEKNVTVEQVAASRATGRVPDGFVSSQSSEGTGGGSAKGNSGKPARRAA